jgi:hypothetical protein
MYVIVHVKGFDVNKCRVMDFISVMTLRDVVNGRVPHCSVETMWIK